MHEHPKPFLHPSRAPDGVIIARVVNPPFHEFWTGKKWSAAGKVYTDGAEVVRELSRVRRLCENPSLVNQ